jgi:hypothetical protein
MISGASSVHKEFLQRMKACESFIRFVEPRQLTRQHARADFLHRLGLTMVLFNDNDQENNLLHF